MIILLGIVLEFATFLGSIAIVLNAGLDSVLEISENGYKFDKSVLEEVQKKQKQNLANRVLGTILFFVPGVNLINASIKGVKLKKSVINDPQIKGAIVPMTEKEKEQYAKMEGKLQKFTFAAFTTMKEKEEDFFGFIGKTPVSVDHGLTSLNLEALLPLGYTLDEVERLNEATKFSYRIGKVDGKNVAIIGLPNPNKSVSRIQFKAEGYKITHNYEKMSLEEAQDKTFIVYPFSIYDDTQRDVEKVVQEIKQSRILSASKANVESLKVQPRFEQEVIPTEAETVLFENEQGLRLARTMYPKSDKK